MFPELVSIDQYNRSYFLNLLRSGEVLLHLYVIMCNMEKVIPIVLFTGPYQRTYRCCSECCIYSKVDQETWYVIAIL